MDLELYSLLSTVIALATGATIVVAVLAYVLFRIRERRGAQWSEPQGSPMRPSFTAAVATGSGSAEPRFFKRYQPADTYEIPKN